MAALLKTVMFRAAQAAVRSVRLVGAPLVNRIKARERRRDGLAEPFSRAALVRTIGLAEVLEIGPFFTPLLRGPNVRYFDVLDQTALQQRAREVGGKPAEVPTIDYVSPHGDLTIVDRRFDAVVSSHVIEHQPDLVRHLNDAAALLRPGGDYWVIVPDRRYSFDHGLAESSHNAMVAAHAERRRVHSAADIRMHLTETVHNNALLHWLGWHRASRRPAGYLDHAEREVRRAARGDYVDVHAWIFSPASFRSNLNALRQAGLSPFAVSSVTDTAFGRLEFMARLTLAT